MSKNKTTTPRTATPATRGMENPGRLPEDRTTITSLFSFENLYTY